MIDYFEWPLPYNEVGPIYLDNVSYIEAVWLTSHNSFASIDEGWKYHPLQKLNLADQFNYGVRAFMIDIHKNSNGELILQHGHNVTLPFTIGRFGFGGVHHSTNSTPFYVSEYFQEIEQLLKMNSQKIITLHVESYVPNKDIKSALQENGLGGYLLLTNNPNSKELTLGEMRDQNQRLVVLTNKFDYEKGIFGSYLYKETTYSLEKDQMCVDRGEGRANFNDAHINLFVFNHFYTISCGYNYGYIGAIAKIVKRDCDLTNEYKVIFKRVNFCLQKNNFPNFIAVDFVERGNFGGAREVVRTMNSIGKAKMINDASSCSTKLK